METATVNELSQIHEMGTYVPLNAGELSPEQKAKALSSLRSFICASHIGCFRAILCNFYTFSGNAGKGNTKKCKRLVFPKSDMKRIL